MNMDKLREFLALDAEKKALDKSLKETDAKRKAVMAELVAEFEAEGVSNMKVDGKTVYLFSQKWAGVAKAGDEATEEERRRAVQALKDAGLDNFVQEQFNSMTLSAYVREVLEEAPLEIKTDPARWYEVLPPTFEGAIHVSEKVDLRTRSGK